MTITTDLGSGTLDEIKGLHEEDNTSLKTIQDTLQQILEAVTGISGGTGEGMTENIGDKLKETLGNSADSDVNESSSAKGGDDAKNDKPKMSLDIKVNDMANYAGKNVMGALLVNSTLSKMQKQLNVIIKKMSTAGNKNAGDIGGKIKGGKKTTNIENTTNINLDPKQVSGLSKALLQFGKAMILLALLPMKIVKSGTKTFMYFIDAMVTAANRMNKGGEDFQKFATGITQLVGCLKTYALAVLLLTLVLPLTPFALISVAMMAVMIALLSLVGRMARGAVKPLQQMAIAMREMAKSMIISIIAVSLCILVGNKVMKALPMMAFMVMFLITVMIVGLLCKLLNFVLPDMCAAFLMLGLAFFLLSIAIKTMSKIKMSQEITTNFVNVLWTLAMGLVKALNPLIIACVTAIVLSIFSVLFFVSLVLLTLSVLLLIAFQKIVEKSGLFEKDEIPAITYLNGIAKQFADNKDNFIAGMIAVIPFTIFAGLFLISMIIMTIGAVLLWVIDMILGPLMDDSDPENVTCRPVTFVLNIAKYMGLHIPEFTMGMVAAVPATVFAGLMAAFAVLALVAATALVGVQKAVNKLGSVKQINDMGIKLKESGIGIMLGFLGVEYKAGDKITIGKLVDGGKNAVKMAAAAALGLGAILPVAGFMVAAATIGKSMVYLSDNLKKINVKTVSTVFHLLSLILSSLGTFAAQMRGSSAKTIKAIGELVKDVATAIGMLVDIVVKLKDGIPDSQIDAATASMKRICERLFGRPDVEPEDGEYTLTMTLETIASANLKNINAQAVEAIVPLMDGISRMADVVIKLSDESVFSQERIETGIDNMGMFLQAMSTVSTAMTGLIKKEATGEIIKGKHVWNKDQPVYKSPLDAINEVVNAGFFTSMNKVMNGLQNIGLSLQNFDPEKLTSIAEFLSNGSIITMAINAPKFEMAIKQFESGIETLKPTAIKNFSDFLNTIGQVDINKLAKTTAFMKIMAGTALKFQSIADSFTKIANAITLMAKKSGDVIDMFEAMKSGGGEVSDQTKSATGEVGGTTVDPFVEKIYTVLDDWNTNGVPLRAKMDSETGEISPIEEDNDTGKGKNRK